MPEENSSVAVQGIYLCLSSVMISIYLSSIYNIYHLSIISINVCVFIYHTYLSSVYHLFIYYQSLSLYLQIDTERSVSCFSKANITLLTSIFILHLNFKVLLVMLFFICLFYFSQCPAQFHGRSTIY